MKMDFYLERAGAASWIVQTGILLLTLFIASGAMAQQGGWYSSRQCRMKFQIPSGWTAHPLTPDRSGDSKNAICIVRLQPRNIADLIHQNDEVDLYTIEIATVVADNFDHAAESGGFERRKDGWVVLGRTDIESPAHSIKSSRWKGLEATATVGCFHENGGGYAGLCDAPTAVVYDGAKTSAVLDGKPQSSDQFEKILKTFEFLH